MAESKSGNWSDLSTMFSFLDRSLKDLKTLAKSITEAERIFMNEFPIIDSPEGRKNAKHLYEEHWSELCSNVQACVTADWFLFMPFVKVTKVSGRISTYVSY